MIVRSALVILSVFLLISCSRVEVVTDPYWDILTEDFQKNNRELKFQAFIRGIDFKKQVADPSTFSVSSLSSSPDKADLFLFSPLLSKSSSFSVNSSGPEIYYIFNESSIETGERKDNVYYIKYDRGDSFSRAGEVIAGRLEDREVLAFIYDSSNSRISGEAEYFLDALNISDKKIEIISFKIDNDTSGADVRAFFGDKKVSEALYTVIFTDKLKRICYDLSVKNDKKVVTSDIWFLRTSDSPVVLSIEDDIGGLLKSIYKNMKRDSHKDLILSGIIR